jgi:hypothetical protein
LPLAARRRRLQAGFFGIQLRSLQESRLGEAETERLLHRFSDFLRLFKFSIFPLQDAQFDELLPP